MYTKLEFCVHINRNINIFIISRHWLVAIRKTNGEIVVFAVGIIQIAKTSRSVPDPRTLM